VLGAVAVYAAARGVGASAYLRAVAPFLKRAEAEFRRDSLLYMLALRWLPVLPYFVANAIPSVLGALFRPYLAATLVGVIPDMATYSIVGSTVDASLASGRFPDVAELVSRLAPALIALGLLPVLGLIARRVMANLRRQDSRPED